jgi:alkanesulfonate monooxygenase SsuD/methylene tetrahydromethanopterin reductase-like flavin-dependent oxidoreductase (luciferase family)
MKFFAAISPFIGRTMEEAQAKFDRAAEHADIIGGLAQFSGYTNIDMSKYPLDEELKLDTSNPADNVIHGFLGNYIDSIDTEKEPWTPRRLGMKMALGGLHPSPVGTPEMIADIIEQVFLLILQFALKEVNNCDSGSMKQILMASTLPTSVIQAVSKTSSPCCVLSSWSVV